MTTAAPRPKPRFAVDLEASPRAAAGSRFGYDAVEQVGRRKLILPLMQSEDRELDWGKRDAILAMCRDLPRNLALCAWMIRKHLDYVAKFSFTPRSGNAATDAALKARVAAHSARGACDYTGRHSLPRLMRLIETGRTMDGDQLIVKLANGSLQVIEGDRLRTPLTQRQATSPGPGPQPQWIQGVQVDAGGRPQSYAVHRRGLQSVPGQGAGLWELERTVPATNAWLHGYFQRYDQYRGISPLASAVHQLRDVYEGLDYSLAKLKIAQLFGLVLFSDDNQPVLDKDGRPVSPIAGQDLTKGPWGLALPAGDRVEFVEPKVPATETQAFLVLMIQIGMKALDLPYSFFAENFSNYSGSRQALLQYEQSADAKRTDNRELLDELTTWWLLLDQQQGLLDRSIDLDATNWEWIPAGLPWVDPLKEAQAYGELLDRGLTSRTQIMRRMNLVFEDIANERAGEERLLRELGLSFAAPAKPAPAAGTPSDEDPDETDPDADDEDEPDDEEDSNDGN